MSPQPRLSFRHVVLACVLVVGVSACSDDGDSSSSGDSAPAGDTLAPGATTLTGETFAPQTTFMPDCVKMPTAADLSTLVGIPLDLGYVTATGTCEFRGLNDQTRNVLLSLFTDPGDQAAFLDLQASLGESTPLGDAELANALVGPNFVVYLSTAEGLYTVTTAVSDAPPAEQVPLSVAVLKRWVTL